VGWIARQQAANRAEVEGVIELRVPVLRQQPHQIPAVPIDGEQALTEAAEAAVAQPCTGKTDDRLLFRVSVAPAKVFPGHGCATAASAASVNACFSIDRDGRNLCGCWRRTGNAELDYAFDLGAIRSLLPRDPAHILMVVDGEDGPQPVSR